MAECLVRMAEGQSVTFKLTKKADDLDGIGELPTWIDAHGSASSSRVMRMAV